MVEFKYFIFFLTCEAEELFGRWIDEHRRKTNVRSGPHLKFCEIQASVGIFK